MQRKNIIGITGHSGSGKGTIAQHLADHHGAKYIKYSDVFRNILDELHIEQSRKNIDHISVTLREAFGQDLLGEVVKRKIQDSNEKLFVIEAIRRPADIEDLLEIGDFTLLFVDVPIKIRYERVVSRGQNPGDADKTFEEFAQDQKDDTQTRIESLRDEATHIINNTRSEKELFQDIEGIIKEITR